MPNTKKDNLILIRSKKASDTKAVIEKAVDSLQNEWNNITEDKPKEKSRKPRETSKPVDIPVVEAKKTKVKKKTLDDDEDHYNSEEL